MQLLGIQRRSSLQGFGGAGIALDEQIIAAGRGEALQQLVHHRVPLCQRRTERPLTEQLVGGFKLTFVDFRMRCCQ
ncbi:hypothetical protein CP916_23735 [Pseudomonas aeruginosa]|nr:hypothetical protein CP916_23735 [Pseudomonas aeruginosa]PCN01758.1 hypothetical protein CP915_26430 [Pseudomonas aeruginosa]PCN09988.1 hypothetical protein CP914_27055 [Pseudomonas aeruginosa]CAB5714736.1 Uncharacterised protein [Pseudomonas aeruginosa]